MARPISRPDGGVSGDAGRAERPRRMLKPIQPDQLTWRTGTGNIEPTPGSAPRSFPPHRATAKVPLSVPEGLPVTPSRRRLLLAAATTLALTGAGSRRSPRRPTTGRPRADRQRRLQRRSEPLVLVRHRPSRGHRRPALHHRRGWAGQPLGRRHRPGRGAADRGRRIHPRLRRLCHPGRRGQGRAATRQCPLHHVRGRGRQRDRHRPAGRADLHRPGRQPERPTDLPGRRLPRDADHLPRRRLAARR